MQASPKQARPAKPLAPDCADGRADGCAAGRTAGRARAASFALVLLVAATPPLVDLDVSVPPGSPLDWGRAFPALTPADGAFYPITETAGTETASSPASESAGEGRTSTRSEQSKLDVRFSSSFDLTRILTYDIVVELDWVETRPRPERSGRSSALPALPVAGPSESRP